MKNICFSLAIVIALMLTALPGMAWGPVYEIGISAEEMRPDVKFPPPEFLEDEQTPSVNPNGCTVTEGVIVLVDTDCDGIADKYDNCDTVLNCDQADWDSNGIGDACQDNDHDNIYDATYDQDETVNHVLGCDTDTVVVNRDNCPLLYNPGQEDVDDDGFGDLCDDDDNDGVIDIDDNCPDFYNSTQADRDEDSIGDDCDNCPLKFNPDQEDEDDDGIGDLCGPDADKDGVPDIMDNCVVVKNPDQEDMDGDAVGDVCDNCPADANEEQLDSDANGIGDVCEPETGYSTTDPTDMPAPAENPTFEVGERIAGGGGFTSNNCQLIEHAGPTIEAVAGMLLITMGAIPLAVRRRKRRQ